jgi:hypothetical protein
LETIYEVIWWKIALLFDSPINTLIILNDQVRIKNYFF